MRLLLGDKSNHVPAFHVPQIYYFVGFATAFFYSSDNESESRLLATAYGFDWLTLIMGVVVIVRLLFTITLQSASEYEFIAAVPDIAHSAHRAT